MQLAGKVTAQGNLNAITDGMGGIHMALAAIEIAALNVRINLTGLDDETKTANYSGRIGTIVDKARADSAALLAAASERANLR